MKIKDKEFASGFEFSLMHCVVFFFESGGLWCEVFWWAHGELLRTPSIPANPTKLKR